MISLDYFNISYAQVHSIIFNIYNNSNFLYTFIVYLRIYGNDECINNNILHL